MHPGGPNQWISDWWASDPRDEASAFFVEARTTARYGSFWFYRIGTSQPRFLLPRPPADILSPPNPR